MAAMALEVCILTAARAGSLRGSSSLKLCAWSESGACHLHTGEIGDARQSCPMGTSPWDVSRWPKPPTELRRWYIMIISHG